MLLRNIVPLFTIEVLKDIMDIDLNKGVFHQICAAQGFRIDCGEDFCQIQSEIFNLDFNNLEEALEPIQDIDLLGSIIFSQYRYITHWSQTGLTDPKACNWFIVALRRLKELTKKSNA